MKSPRQQEDERAAKILLALMDEEDAQAARVNRVMAWVLVATLGLLALSVVSLITYAYVSR